MSGENKIKKNMLLDPSLSVEEKQRLEFLNELFNVVSENSNVDSVTLNRLLDTMSIENLRSLIFSTNVHPLIVRICNDNSVADQDDFARLADVLLMVSANSQLCNRILNEYETQINVLFSNVNAGYDDARYIEFVSEYNGLTHLEKGKKWVFPSREMYSTIECILNCESREYPNVKKILLDVDLTIFDGIPVQYLKTSILELVEFCSEVQMSESDVFYEEIGSDLLTFFVSYYKNPKMPVEEKLQALYMIFKSKEMASLYFDRLKTIATSSFSAIPRDVHTKSLQTRLEILMDNHSLPVSKEKLRMFVNSTNIEILNLIVYNDFFVDIVANACCSDSDFNYFGLKQLSEFIEYSINTLGLPATVSNLRRGLTPLNYAITHGYFDFNFLTIMIDKNEYENIAGVRQITLHQYQAVVFLSQYADEENQYINLLLKQYSWPCFEGVSLKELEICVFVVDFVFRDEMQIDEGDILRLKTCLAKTLLHIYYMSSGSVLTIDQLIAMALTRISSEVNSTDAEILTTLLKQVDRNGLRTAVGYVESDSRGKLLNEFRFRLNIKSENMSESTFVMLTNDLTLEQLTALNTHNEIFSLFAMICSSTCGLNSAALSDFSLFWHYALRPSNLQGILNSIPGKHNGLIHAISLGYSDPEFLMVMLRQPTYGTVKSVESITLVQYKMVKYLSNATDKKESYKSKVLELSSWPCFECMTVERFEFCFFVIDRIESLIFSNNASEEFKAKILKAFVHVIYLNFDSKSTLKQLMTLALKESQKDVLPTEYSVLEVVFTHSLFLKVFDGIEERFDNAFKPKESLPAEITIHERNGNAENIVKDVGEAREQVERVLSKVVSPLDMNKAKFAIEQMSNGTLIFLANDIKSIERTDLNSWIGNTPASVIGIVINACSEWNHLNEENIGHLITLLNYMNEERSGEFDVDYCARNFYNKFSTIFFSIQNGITDARFLFTLLSLQQLNIGPRNLMPTSYAHECFVILTKHDGIETDVLVKWLEMREWESFGFISRESLLSCVEIYRMILPYFLFDEGEDLIYARSQLFGKLVSLFSSSSNDKHESSYFWKIINRTAPMHSRCSGVFLENVRKNGDLMKYLRGVFGEAKTNGEVQEILLEQNGNVDTNVNEKSLDGSENRIVDPKSPADVSELPLVNTAFENIEKNKSSEEFSNKLDVLRKDEVGDNVSNPFVSEIHEDDEDDKMAETKHQNNESVINKGAKHSASMEEESMETTLERYRNMESYLLNSMNAEAAARGLNVKRLTLLRKNFSHIITRFMAEGDSYCTELILKFIIALCEKDLLLSDSDVNHLITFINYAYEESPTREFTSLFNNPDSVCNAIRGREFDSEFLCDIIQIISQSNEKMKNFNLIAIYNGWKVFQKRLKTFSSQYPFLIETAPWKGMKEFAKNAFQNPELLKHIQCVTPKLLRTCLRSIDMIFIGAAVVIDETKNKDIREQMLIQLLCVCERNADKITNLDQLLLLTNSYLKDRCRRNDNVNRKLRYVFDYMQSGVDDFFKRNTLEREGENNNDSKYQELLRILKESSDSDEDLFYRPYKDKPPIRMKDYRECILKNPEMLFLVQEIPLNLLRVCLDTVDIIFDSSSYTMGGPRMAEIKEQTLKQIIVAFKAAEFPNVDLKGLLNLTSEYWTNKEPDNCYIEDMLDGIDNIFRNNALENTSCGGDDSLKTIVEKPIVSPFAPEKKKLFSYQPEKSQNVVGERLEEYSKETSSSVVSETPIVGKPIVSLPTPEKKKLFSYQPEKSQNVVGERLEEYLVETSSSVMSDTPIVGEPTSIIEDKVLNNNDCRMMVPYYSPKYYGERPLERESVQLRDTLVPFNQNYDQSNQFTSQMENLNPSHKEAILYNVCIILQKILDVLRYLFIGIRDDGLTKLPVQSGVSEFESEYDGDYNKVPFDTLDKQQEATRETLQP